jgi:hypothetical protein
MSEQAGREMDARVAEKVMGFDCKHVDDGEGWCQFCGEEMIEYSQMYWDQNKWLQDRQSRPVETKCQGLHYSTSIAAAWEIVEALRQKYCCIKVYSDHAYIYECTIVKDPDDDHDEPEIFTQADTAPLAICLAALKAVGA